MQGGLEDGEGVNGSLYNRAELWVELMWRQRTSVPGTLSLVLKGQRVASFLPQKTRTPGHLTARERRPGAGMAIGKKAEVLGTFFFLFYFSPALAHSC